MGRSPSVEQGGERSVVDDNNGDDFRTVFIDVDDAMSFHNSTQMDSETHSWSSADSFALGPWGVALHGALIETFPGLGPPLPLPYREVAGRRQPRRTARYSDRGLAMPLMILGSAKRLLRRQASV